MIHPHLFSPENILGRRWLRIQTAPEQYILKGNLIGSNVVAYVDLLIGDVRLVTKIGKRFNWLTDFYASASDSRQLTDVFDFHPENNLAFQIERGPDDSDLSLLFYKPEAVFGDLNGQKFFLTSDGSLPPLQTGLPPAIFRGLNLPLQKLLDLLEKIGAQLVKETVAAPRFSLGDLAHQIINYRKNQGSFNEIDIALAGIEWEKIDIEKLTDDEVNNFTRLFDEFDEAQLAAAAARQQLPGLFPFWVRGEWQSLEDEDLEKLVEKTQLSPLMAKLLWEAAAALKSFTAYINEAKITCQLAEKKIITTEQDERGNLLETVQTTSRPDCRLSPLPAAAQSKIQEGIQAYDRVLQDYLNFANSLEEQVFTEVLTK